MSVKGFKSHPYIPNSVPEVEREMLKELGLTALEELHEQYMATRASMLRDANYILKATSLLMAGCLPAA